MTASKVAIIGSGFSALSAACYLAKAGYTVEIFEKNTQFGGRARQLKKDGFTFDIGPTFYWMPDVFDDFFADFSKKTSDYYQLHRLNPSYEVYFGEGEQIRIADNLPEIQATFEAKEKGSAARLQRFLSQAKDNYDIAIKDLVYQPGEHLFEIINTKTAAKLGLFVRSVQGQVRSQFRHEQLRKVLEFPVLFLGAKPSDTPAFYNFMNYADFVLGTWHPQGGMYQVVEALLALARSLGVVLHADAPVSKIATQNRRALGIESQGHFYPCDIVLSGADYHHTEQLLPADLRQYSEQYWNKRTFAPSALLFFVGFSEKLQNVAHHTLFFDTDFEAHAACIYDTPAPPSEPLFYASFPSKSDATCAPPHQEAGIFLIPLAPALPDSEALRQQYFDKIMERLQEKTQQNVRDLILFSQSYGVNDFVQDYHSYKGNAYGLANTLLQTHFLRPKLKSKKVENLYFTGQLTVPGPGVPPSLISGKIVSDLICKYHEIFV